MDGWRQDHGAALVELLVSIAVVALLAVGATSLTLMTIRAEQRVGVAAADVDALATGASLFRQLMTSARPVKESGRVLFEGRADEIVMVVRSPFEALPPGDYDAHLSIAAGPEGLLMLALTSRSDLGIAVERPIMSGAKDIAFFGKIMGADQPAWHDTWSHPLVGPDQVRLRLEAGDYYASPRLLQARGGGS